MVVCKIFSIALASILFIVLFHSGNAETVGQPLLCHGCLAAVSEMHKFLRDSYGRPRLVKAAVGKLCHTDNFVVYKFSPPKMVKACNYIVENYRDKFEETLSQFYKKYKVKDNHMLHQEFCIEKIQACENILSPEERFMVPPSADTDEATTIPEQQFSENTLEKPPINTTPHKDEL